MASANEQRGVGTCDRGFVLLAVYDWDGGSELWVRIDQITALREWPHANADGYRTGVAVKGSVDTPMTVLDADTLRRLIAEYVRP
jgi:hypothetical protein